MQKIPERSMVSFPSKNQVKQELEIDEQSENRPLSSDLVIDFVEKAKVGHWPQHPQLKVSLLMFPSLKLGFNYVYLHYV